MFECLTLLAGLFVLSVGLHCLPKDIRMPWGGGVFGLPVDVALIVFGLIMIWDGIGG